MYTVKSEAIVHCACEPVWPSGKALGWKAELGPRFDSLRLSFLFKNCGLWTLSCDFGQTINEILKWLTQLPTLTQNHSGGNSVARVGVRYKIPDPPTSPSLISLNGFCGRKAPCFLLWGCTVGGVYVPCIYSHARWCYRSRFRSLLLCPLSVEFYYFPFFVDSYGGNSPKMLIRRSGITCVAR